MNILDVSTLHHDLLYILGLLLLFFQTNCSYFFASIILSRLNVDNTASCEWKNKFPI